MHKTLMITIQIQLLVLLVQGLDADPQPQKRMRESFEKVMLTEMDPLAICNDGSPAVYYWKKSPTGSNRWFVELLGGSACWDEASCDARRKNPNTDCCGSMTSSKDKHQVWQFFGGIVSPDPNVSPLWDANKVVLHHCSSDYFMGALGGPDKAEKKWGLYFRG